MSELNDTDATTGNINIIADPFDPAADRKNPNTQTTYVLERLRAIPAGIIESSTGTFFLLIALQAFQAGPLSKSLIVAGGNIGMLLTPFVVMAVERKGITSMRAAAGLLLVGAAALTLAALLPFLPVYVGAVVIAYAITNMVIPLFTPVYQSNYPARERGKYVSRSIVVRVAIAAVCGDLVGRMLTADIGLFRVLLVVVALAFLASSFIAIRIPSQPLHVRSDIGRSATGTVSWLDSLRQIWFSMSFLKTDRLFRNTMAAWMFMGFANLIMVPLRIEYLVNPAFGISLNAQETAMLTIVIPSLARLVMSPVFGWIFDRMNFFATRVALNIAFALSIIMFFTGTSTLGLVVGALIFGIALAGGDILWSLWVTKFAPPHRVADYIAVHTFFTGVRGVIAPIIAFQLITKLPIGEIGIICAVLIGLASLILLPEMKRAMRRTVPS